MDWFCPQCGEQHHVDADFCYYLKCLDCGSVFEVGTEVSLTKVDPSSVQDGFAKECSSEDYGRTT